MRKHILKINVCAISILLSLILSAPVNTFGGWGVERGRANEGDNARLVQDKIAMMMAQNRINEAIARPLGIERQRQLLGVSDGGDRDSGELMDSVLEWWLKDVMGPAQAIAGNPAASCAEAQVASQSLLGMMRQRSLLGISPPDENDNSASATKARAVDADLETRGKSITSNILARCREEALDECVVTGRFEEIITSELGIMRQDSLLGGAERSDHNAWAEDALKQCAIYELHFVSTAKFNEKLKIDTVLDGRITIKFEAGAAGIFVTGRKLGDVLNGETKGGVNPFLVSLVCNFPPDTATCGPGATPTNPFKALIQAMELQHTVFEVDANGASKQRTVGKDKLSLEFYTGGMMTQAVIKFRDGGGITIPIEAGGTAFGVAHKKDRIGNAMMYKFEHNKRGVYPVIFDFIYAGQDTEGGVSATDSTEFKLIHKPKPDPLPARAPEPTRTPLKKRSKGLGS